MHVRHESVTTLNTAKETYDDAGFVLGPEVLNGDQVEVLRNEIADVIDRRADHDVPQPVVCDLFGSRDEPLWQIVNISAASAPFRELAHAPALTEWAAALTGAAELRLWHDQVQFKPQAVGGENNWHQDAPYWPLYPSSEMITAWVALDDAGDHNGCMKMVPRSHRWGRQIDFLHRSAPTHDCLPDRFEDRDVTPVSCPVRAGHVHFHHPLTWHGSPANRSDVPRRAIAIHYATDRALFGGPAPHPMVPFVTSDPGAPLAGDPFVVVWRR